jgi:hypothetical protein
MTALKLTPLILEHLAVKLAYFLVTQKHHGYHAENLLTRLCSRTSYEFEEINYETMFLIDETGHASLSGDLLSVKKVLQ